MKITSLLLAAFVFLFAAPLFSQNTQRITGKVFNTKNEPLTGVSITVTGSSKGTTSNVEGRFTVIAEAGKPVSITFSAIGYQTKTSDNIAAGPDDLSVVLEDAKKNLDNVTVRSSTRRETTGALIAYQKNTSTVAQVISAEAIRRSPDRNTGEVLKRIPGTSIQEGKYLVVRGLSDRYNQAMLNGILLNSTEPDRKTFSFDIFPSAIVDNIIINKSFIPELSGEWAGGLVQVNTKDVPAVNFFNIQIGTGFNTQTIGKDFYTYKGGKTDWLGIDDGTRGLPANTPLRSKFNSSNTAEKIEYGKQFENVWTAEKNASKFLPILNKSFQINGGFNQPLKNNSKLGGIMAITYSQSNRRTAFKNTLYGFVNNAPFVNFDYDNVKYSQDVLWGALGNLTFQLGANHKISFKNLINVNASDYTTLRTGKDFELNSTFGENIKATELALKSNTFFNTQLSGDHNLPSLKSKLHWYASFNILDQYIPDQRRLQYNQDPDPTIINAPYLASISVAQSSQKSGSRYYGFLSDYVYVAGGDLSTNFRLFDLNQTIKGGYFFQVKDRLFDSRPFAVYIPNGENQALQILPADQVFNPDNFGNGFDRKFAFNELSGDRYRYIANTILNAGFLQFDNQFSDKLRATWGVRVEDYDQVIGSLKQSDPRHLHTETTDFLPGFNLTFKANNTTNIRLTGSQTVIRPEFRELSDFQFYDFELGATVAGSRSLVRTKVTNADLRYELYPRAGELFTVGVFYKYFKNPIESYFNPASGSASTFNYLNADKANAFGVEMEFRKKLDFANALKNFTFQTNISYIYNRVESESAQFKRPMQGQSPYVLNAALQYDVEKLGISTTLLYNKIGDRILFVGGNDTPPIWEASRNLLDFAVAKKVLKSKGEIKLSASDLFNQSANFYHDLNANRKYDKGSDALAIKRKYGTNVSLTFSYAPTLGTGDRKKARNTE